MDKGRMSESDYGRRSTHLWRRETRQVAEGFLGYFAERGLGVEAPVAITSGVDPSVRFVGSTVSVLKAHLGKPGPPAPGLCLAQPAVRTQNLRRLLDDDTPLQWSSLFLALGTLVPYACLGEATQDVFAWLTGPAGVPAARLVVRGSSADSDLVATMRAGNKWRVELDTCEQSQFRHRYGMESVVGRNVNFAIRGRCGQLNDFANLIVIDREGESLAVEFAVGVSALLARKHDLEHPLQASPVADCLPTGTDHQRRLADAVAVAAQLLREGLRPVSRGRGGILRGYLRAVAELASEDCIACLGSAAGTLANDAVVSRMMLEHITRLRDR
jgi:hypothetical protein